MFYLLAVRTGDVLSNFYSFSYNSVFFYLMISFSRGNNIVKKNSQ